MLLCAPCVSVLPWRRPPGSWAWASCSCCPVLASFFEGQRHWAQETSEPDGAGQGLLGVSCWARPQSAHLQQAGQGSPLGWWLLGETLNVT